MSNRGSRRLRRAALAGTGTVLVLGTMSACAGGGEDGDQVMVTAAFNDVSPMVPGNVVKASGVKVGSIEDIRLVDGVAQVKMKVDRAILPLNKDATATVVTQDLLGERFIELDRGTPEMEDLGEDDVIGLKQTRRVVDLDQVLNTVDDPTGTSLAAMLSTLGEGMAGNGPAVAKALKELAPAMRDVESFGAVLRDHNEELNKMVEALTPVAGAVGAERGRKLDQLVADATRTLDTIRVNREALASSLRELPETLAQARQSLAKVAGVSESTAGTLADVRPLTDDLATVSNQLKDYAQVADPALASLVPVLERGEKLIDEAAPLVDALAPAEGSISSVARSGRTLVEQALSKRLVDLMEFVKGWSLATTDYDAISHYFKAMVPVSPRVLGQLATGPIPGAKSPVPDLPLPSPPDLPLPGREDDGKGSEDSGTGLTVKQENSLLEQLLGGRQ